MTIDQGFAIRRNGSCLAGIEVNCGKTANGMVGCCPSGYECPHAYNLDCCPSGQGGKCTPELVKAPGCANSTWDLYDNGGYFCCEHGSPGYNRSNTNICAEPGSSNNGNLLKLITAGQSATSSSSAAFTSSSFAASTSSSAIATSESIASTSAPPTPSQAPSDESTTPVGAIAGGVVGGVAGLAILALVAWLVMRRRRQNKPENPYSAVHRSDENGSQDTPMVHQLDDTQRVYEAGVGKTTYAYAKEMPAQSAPVELPAEDHPPR